MAFCPSGVAMVCLEPLLSHQSRKSFRSACSFWANYATLSKKAWANTCSDAEIVVLTIRSKASVSS